MLSLTRMKKFNKCFIATCFLSWLIIGAHSGIPNLTTNTTITIVVDKLKSHPRFSHSEYTADLMDLELNDRTINHVGLSFLQGDIQLTRVYGNITIVSIVGTSEGNKNHIAAEQIDADGQSNETALISVALLDLTESFLRQKVISAILSVANERVKANTTLHIILPQLPEDYGNNGGVTVSRYSSSKNMYLISSVVLFTILMLLFVCVTYLFVANNSWTKVAATWYKSNCKNLYANQS